jgi:hypothetical protein
MVDTVASIFAGVGLAAACGFRVFVPLLVLSIAATLDVIPLAGDFAWIATTPALVALATATIMEIAAYYSPWLDHALDVVATPAAVLAGVITTAAVVSELSPVLRWTLAIVGGGGVAGAVQGATVLLRLKSGVIDGGDGVLNGNVGACRRGPRDRVRTRGRNDCVAGDAGPAGTSHSQARTVVRARRRNPWTTLVVIR